MKFLPLVLSACLTATALAEDAPNAAKPSPTPTPTLRESVDSLDESQIQKAIDALAANYLSPEAIDNVSRQKALLEGLLLRLGAGADFNQAGNATS